MDIFGDEKWTSKQVTPALWENIQQLISTGIVISHIEVLQEIKKEGKKGEELYAWAHAHEDMFCDYDWAAEGAIIRTMSPKYGAFVNGKVSAIHADPWLVAQAKHRQLTLITEEKRVGSPDPKKHRLPNVCSDPAFGVRYVDLLGLVKENGWSFDRIAVRQ